VAVADDRRRSPGDAVHRREKRRSPASVDAGRQLPGTNHSLPGHWPAVQRLLLHTSRRRERRGSRILARVRRTCPTDETEKYAFPQIFFLQSCKKRVIKVLKNAETHLHREP